MFIYFCKVYNLLSFKQKVSFFGLIFLLIFSAFLETFSIIAILPAANIITDGDKFLSDYKSFIIINNFKFLFNLEKEKLLLLFIFILTLVFFVKNIIIIFITYLKEKYFFHLRLNIQKKMYKTYLFQKYNSHSKKNSALFINNIINESALIIDMAIKNYINFFQELSVIIVIVFFLFFLNPLITLGSLFFLVLLFFLVYLPSKKFIKKYSYIRQINEEKRIQDLNETFGNFKYIKILSLENFFLKFFSAQNILINKSIFVMSFIAALPSKFFETFIIISIFLICYYLYLEEYSISDITTILLAYSLCGIRLLPSLNKIFIYVHSVKFSYPAIEKVYNDLFLANDFENIIYDQNFNQDKIKKIDIKIKKFDYNEDKVIFFDTELNISIKDRIFIKGTSGSGKTTLINLVTGLVEDDRVEILLNNKVIDSTNNLYKLINFGYVPQEVFLSNTSIKENIILNKKYEKNKFDKIISICDLEKFINNQINKENTIISERASNISGGQKQRIALARALMNNSQVLILDEATNGLDAQTEERVMNGIIKNYPDLIIIAISHKETLQKYFNKIYEINNKKLVLKNIL
jgi:ABC-type multidrug transport system fused ATPase/permease subunit